MAQRESNQQLWSAWKQEQAASGLAIHAWCVRAVLTASTFRYGRKRLVTPSRPATSLIARPGVGRRVELVLEVMTPLDLCDQDIQEQLGCVNDLLEVLR